MAPPPSIPIQSTHKHTSVLSTTPSPICSAVYPLPWPMTTVLSPLLHLLKLGRRRRITSAMKTGCAAGDFCEYDTSAVTKKRTPATRFKCFICNGKVHQEYSCAETLETLMKRGHTLRHEYLSPHDLQCFEDAVACLNGGNRFKPVPTKDVWQQNETERASSNILQIPIAPSLTQQTQTKINRGE